MISRILLVVLFVGVSLGTHQKVVLSEAASRLGAVCLDGTPGALYIREGSGSGAHKWYIHHQGGGWCNSLADCYGRSQTDLGSSKNYPATLDLDYSYFSTDPNVNPQMYNWNSVFLSYCDGGSFSGNNETIADFQGHSLFFRGFRVLSAMAENLLNEQGLSTATDVVISGCSAGGLATFLHVDWWHSLLPQSAKVVGMPDSGFFLDYESQMDYHGYMIWVFLQMNSTSGVNSGCIGNYQGSGETWHCIFAQHTSSFIKTPIFPLQSEYDSWQIAYDLDSKDPVVINKYGQALRSLVTDTILNRPQNSIWLHSCADHCGGWGNIHIDGESMATAFQKWYDGNDHKYFQGKDYPCAACCSS